MKSDGSRAPRRTRIRTLGPSEPRPSDTPRRYVNGAGYVRLRWKISRGEYLECYDRDETGQLVREQPGRPRIDRAAVVTLYERGLTQPLIAEHLGCSAGQVSRILAAANVPARSPGDYEPIDEELAERLYRDGQSLHFVARLVGATPGRLRRVLSHRGVRIRPVGRPTGHVAPTYETEFAKARARVRTRSGGRCEAAIPGVCTGTAEHCHHRKLRSRGGGNRIEELLDFCSACHRWVHNNPEAARRRGLLVHGWDDPAEIPVRPGLGEDAA